MPHVSLRVSDREKSLMENYAKLHSVSLSDAVKAVFFEKLEDEFDLKTILEYEECPDDVTYTHAEVGKMLGLK